MRSIKVKLIISTGAMILVSLLFVSVTVLSMQWRSQKESLAGDARYMMRIAYTKVEKFLEAPKISLLPWKATSKPTTWSLRQSKTSWSRR